MFTNHIYQIYVNKPDLALNNPQWLICRKNKLNHKQQKTCKIFESKVTNFSKTIKYLLNNNIKKKSHVKSETVVYSIPC